MRYRVWARLPQLQGTGWSCVARWLTEEEANVYRRTFVFDVRVEPDETRETGYGS